MSAPYQIYLLIHRYLDGSGFQLITFSEDKRTVEAVAEAANISASGKYEVVEVPQFPKVNAL